MPTPNTGTDTDQPQNPLEMSDEDFLNAPPPGSTQEEKPDEKKPEGEDTQAGAEGADGDDTLKGGEEDAEGDSKPDDALKDEPKGDAKPKDEKPKSKGTTSDPENPDGKPDSTGSKPKGEAAPTGEPGADTPATAESMADFYKRVVQTPIKANGKTIKINSAEEAIGLMQMGANYTRKLQELAPVRKIVTMLDKNGLLDEGKLTFLIDIANKNPDAIKKLVKDSGVDPMEINTDEKDTYVPGNHRVSDGEVKFQTVLTTLKGTEDGKETLKIINATWDDASKDILWDEPEVMEAIHEQRGNGVYKTISDEVERQKTVGLIPVDAPFLQAYRFVGDQLAKKSKTTSQADPAPKDTKPEPKIVATRTPPKKVDPNAEKAKAAAGTKGAPGSTRPFVNPLAMADDEFLKTMANRL
jgi:hypothetical protein